MHESSPLYSMPPTPAVPSEEETERRMAFHVLHPEVHIAFRDGRWHADRAGRPRITGATMTDVLDGLAEEFGP